MLLSECSDGKKNIITLLKFIAAIFVIFNHSFPLTGSGGDYISVFSNGQTTFGGVAVIVFFFFGGFLIMKSMERKKTAKDFFKARSLRIFPQLCMVIIVTVIVLGPFVTSLSLSEYFTSLSTYKYLLNCILIPVHNLPGVFENNKYNSTVNGSLWTLPVEFLCYVFCYIFYKLKLNNPRFAIWTIPVVMIGYFVLWRVLLNILVLRGTLIPALVFYFGMIYYIYRDKIKLYWYISALLLIILVVAIEFNCFYIVAPVAFPYILASLGFGIQTKSGKLSENLLLKSSYGIYLVAFPIQQLLCYCIPNIRQITNFIFATLISVLLGVCLTVIDNKKIIIRN